MTRAEWKQLSEQEREAIRQASAAQSQPRQYDLAKDIWIARDQYRVENAALGCLLLYVIAFVFVLLVGLSQVVR